MASDNETVAEISKKQREFAVQVYGANHAPSTEVWKLADQIEAAHKRALAAKNDERLTVVAIYENVIAAKDREIAELRERIKIAEDALEKIDNMCDGDMCKYFKKTHHCSACRYLESCQTGVAHAALAAIRGKGANNGK